MSTDDQGFQGLQDQATHTTQQAAVAAPGITADWLRRNHERVVRDLVRHFAGPTPNRLPRCMDAAAARKAWRQMLRAAVAAERGGRKG